MENKDLLRKLSKLGFPLVEVSEDLRANETISELIKSHDIRLWEGFPVVLANAAKNKVFDINKIKSLLKNRKDYDTFFKLLLISISLYKFLKLRTFWTGYLSVILKSSDKEKIKEFVDKFRNNDRFYVAKKYLSSERLKNIFSNYFTRSGPGSKSSKNNYEELSLEYAMSQIFTLRQKEIFLKRAHGKKMTKTEREYFYRVIKRKAIALANKDLHILSRRVLE